MTDERLSWVHDDSALTARLDEVWPGWDTGELSSQLDNTPGWEGWEAWGGDDKVAQLWQLLEAWYPPEDEVEVAQVDRLAWVHEDAALVERLNSVWPDWAAADGLAATLDHTSEWNGWDGWEAQAKRDYLRVTLDAWYPPATEGAAAPDLEAAVTEAVTEVLHTVTGAADLSEEELGQILAEVLAEQQAAVSGQ